MEITGKIIIEKFGKGSKSEHDAVYIDNGTDKYRLKKKGGNPFHDENLHALVGKHVKLKGENTEHFFEIIDVVEIN